MNPGSENESQRVHAGALRAREELAERITRAVPEDGVVEPLKGIYLRRASTPTELLHGVSDPSFCVIAQGSKEVLLGESVYRYDPAHYLLATVELPIVSHVIEASPERPYLSFVWRSTRRSWAPSWQRLGTSPRGGATCARWT